MPTQLAAADPLVLAAGGSAPLEVPVDGRDDPVPNAQNEDWGTAAVVGPRCVDGRVILYQTWVLGGFGWVGGGRVG